MTKGTLAFRIIICILLVAIILWGAFFTIGFLYYARNYIHHNQYGINVAGVYVTRENKNDVLGDGTVAYDSSSNTLIFNNAVIEYNSTIVYSEIDLRIYLIGENKFVCKDSDYIVAVYAAEYMLYKDISFEGQGSLTIDYQNVTDNAVGIYAGNIIMDANVTVTTPDCINSLTGIACYSSLTLKPTAIVTVNNGVAKDGAAVFVRGNAIVEPGGEMNISVKSGTTGTCRGISVEGDLIVGKTSKFNVSINDETATASECIAVSGVMDIGIDATVTASAKKAHAIECYTSIKLNEGAAVSATSEGKEADILCYGAVVNYGATVNAEIDALGGTHNMSAN